MTANPPSAQIDVTQGLPLDSNFVAIRKNNQPADMTKCWTQLDFDNKAWKICEICNTQINLGLKSTKGKFVIGTPTGYAYFHHDCYMVNRI